MTSDKREQTRNDFHILKKDSWVYMMWWSRESERATPKVIVCERSEQCAFCSFQADVDENFRSVLHRFQSGRWRSVDQYRDRTKKSSRDMRCWLDCLDFQRQCVSWWEYCARTSQSRKAWSGLMGSVLKWRIWKDSMSYFWKRDSLGRDLRDSRRSRISLIWARLLIFWWSDNPCENIQVLKELFDMGRSILWDKSCEHLHGRYSKRKINSMTLWDSQSRKTRKDFCRFKRAKIKRRTLQWVIQYRVSKKGTRKRDFWNQIFEEI